MALSPTTGAVSPDPLQMHAYVMGCRKRPGLILPYLASQSHTLHIGTDYNPGPEVQMNGFYTTCPVISHYRVFRGHQDMAKRFLQTGDDVALMFEDDASPNCINWPLVVNESLATMRELNLEVFYLYGRAYDTKRYQVVKVQSGREVLQLRRDIGATEVCHGGRHHIYGSMAYLITKEAALRWESMDFEGIPVDIILPDRFRFALLHNTPFDHDRRQGSLIDGTPARAPRAALSPAAPRRGQLVVPRPALRPGQTVRKIPQPVRPR